MVTSRDDPHGGLPTTLGECRRGLPDVERLRAFLAYVDGMAGADPTYVGSCLQPEEVEALRRVLDRLEA